jgi:predicted O-methyltransferase YrrM
MKNEKTLPSKEAIEEMRELLWANAETRGRLQDLGLSITPNNFYSTIPSLSDIENSFEYAGDGEAFFDEQIFDERLLLEELEQLAKFSADFNPPLEGDEVNCRNYFWKNSQFAYSDAMAYYALIRRHKPKNIVEIGSGFSSLVALEALDKNGCGALTCIEPYPRPFLEKMANCTVKKVRAQDVPASELNELLNDGDILFIDSTHTVKSGSDCLHIYLRLLPKIKKNIYVHVHDVFLPFGMPKSWLVDQHIYWTEQYLLLAFVIDNPKAKVIFGSAYHYARNREALENLMHKQYPPGGGSFWFKYSGNSTCSGSTKINIENPTK